MLSLPQGYTSGKGNFPPENGIIDCLSTSMFYASLAPMCNLLEWRGLEQNQPLSDIVKLVCTTCYMCILVFEQLLVVCNIDTAYIMGFVIMKNSNNQKGWVGGSRVHLDYHTEKRNLCIFLDLLLLKFCNNQYTVCSRLCGWGQSYPKHFDYWNFIFKAPKVGDGIICDVYIVYLKPEFTNVWHFPGIVIHE